MVNESLGLIETLGLVPAVEAADAGAKAANVRFRGYERAKAGLITVVFTGDVAAVQAAVSAASAAARRVGTVISFHVIARPDRQLQVIRNGSRPAAKAVEIAPIAIAEPAIEIETIPVAEEIVLEEVAAPAMVEEVMVEVAEVGEVSMPAEPFEPAVVEAVIVVEDDGGIGEEEVVEPAEEELVAAAPVAAPRKKEKEKVRKSKSKRRV